MRSRTLTLTALSLGLAACGGGGPSAPPGLAYGLPQSASVRYVSGDTATMDIDAGGQAMQARVTARTTLSAAFARAGEGVQVTMTVEDLDARVVNPMATVTADESEIDGPVVFTLDRRGVSTVVSQPVVGENAGQFFQPVIVAHGFFPRLPGRAAAVGESWTDTIRMEGAQGQGGSISSVMNVTYTVAGDTVVDGRSLVKIDLEGSSDTSAEGVTSGMDYTQTVAGSVTGWVLWDQQRNLMVESYQTTDGQGSMEISAAPFPLGVRVRGVSRVRLQSSR